jgi:lipopolysaccharide transport system permease protein
MYEPSQTARRNGRSTIRDRERRRDRRSPVSAEMMSELPVTVYAPDSVIRRPAVLLRDMFVDLAHSRALAYQLAVRDISAQYRQAFLGILWAFILPLANAAAWIFLSRTGVVSVGATSLPYVAYVATGTVLWAIFMDALNAPLLQTQNARLMLAKLNFPREALILSGVLQTLFNAGIKLVVLFAVLLSLGVYPGWHLLLVPFGVLSLVLVGSAVGLVLTPIGVLYSDVGRAIPLLAQFLMYLTPVVFPTPQSGWARTVFSLNPLTPLVVASRAWMTGSELVHIGAFITVTVIAGALLLLFWIAYRVAIPIVIERIGA